MGLPGQECRLSSAAEWWFSAKWQWILEMELLRTLFAINFHRDLYSRLAVKVTAFRQKPRAGSPSSAETSSGKQPPIGSACPAIWPPELRAGLLKLGPLKDGQSPSETCERPITEDMAPFYKDWEGCGLVWRLIKGLAGFTDPLWAPNPVWIRL